MAGKDPYQILDVKKTDDVSTIKSAFRKLAMKWHPDRNKEPGAKEKFADISKAWAILEDPEKRRAFENGRIDFDGNDLTGMAHGGGFNPGDAFTNNERMKQAFSSFDEETDLDDPALYGFKPQPKPAAAPAGGSLDVQLQVKVSFVQAATGAVLNVGLPGGRQVKTRVPVGVESGKTLKLAGYGKSSGERTGDAYLKIEVKEHAYFSREGNNVRLTVPVALDELLLQKEIEIPTVHGAVKVTPPLGDAFSETQRISGKGINGGDQLVTYRLVLPEQVSSGVKDALKQQAQSNPRKFDI
jgi:DnaJ-class molecular chaperone